MPDLSAWWNPCEILALRRHPRLCLLMPMALWIFTLALKSCIKLSHLFCSGPLLRPEVQNLGFDYPCFIYRSYSLIFLVLYQSLEPDFQALESNSDGLIILPSVRSHTEPGAEWGVMHAAECVCYGPWGQGRETPVFKSRRSLFSTLMGQAWLAPTCFLSFLLWEAKAPKTRLLALKTALLFSVLP